MVRKSNGQVKGTYILREGKDRIVGAWDVDMIPAAPGGDQ
jgi:hypothetical protein